MKQQKLSDHRDYNRSPRSYHEGPDENHRSDLHFTEEDYRDNPTKQSEAEACDINNIMKKYEQTGYAPVNDRVPMYGDYSNVHDFRAALDIVANANSLFYGMDARTRAEFSNDPAQFLEFVDSAGQNPKAAQRLVDLGLAELRPETDREIAKETRDELKKLNEKRNKAAQKAASGASSDE